jgi:hypothetical protein
MEAKSPWTKNRVKSNDKQSFMVIGCFPQPNSVLIERRLNKFSNEFIYFLSDKKKQKNPKKIIKQPEWRFLKTMLTTKSKKVPKRLVTEPI